MADKKITGKTSTGFEYDVDARVFTDWRYIELFADVKDGTDEEKVTATPKWGKFILGRDGMKKLIDHVSKLNDGFAPIEKVIAELAEIKPDEETSKN